jgi:hypothetical protein
LVFYRLRRDLVELLPIARPRIRPETRFVDIIPRRDRRRVWRELQSRGYRLPALQLPGYLILWGTLSVVIRSAAVAWLFKNPLFAAVGLPFAILTWFLARPLAVRPSLGCETIREAVLHVTPFRRVDYEAGLWPRADISAKVRLIIACAAGVPFDRVREDTRFTDLF